MSLSGIEENSGSGECARVFHGVRPLLYQLVGSDPEFRKRVHTRPTRYSRQAPNRYSVFASGQNLKNSAKKIRKGNVTASSADASQISVSYAGGPACNVPVTVGNSARYNCARAVPITA